MKTVLDSFDFAIATVERRLTLHAHTCPCCDRSREHRAFCEVRRDDDGLRSWTWTEPLLCRECEKGE